MGQAWSDSAEHRAWLGAETGRLLDFAERAEHPAGGFAWLDEHGAPVLDRPIEAWVTARSTHVFALGHLMGRPGCGPLVDHGVAALQGLLHDPVHGGWFASVSPDGSPGVEDKRAYEHAFVVLAASSALAAERPGARELLGEALDTVELRFWDDDQGLLADVWDRRWMRLEPYRGVNANMHAVEAFLAASDATGDEVWRRRALRITQRIIDDWARSRDWRLVEHFDEAWQAQPEYSHDEPADPFRPYGVTVGHLLEWSRLCLSVRGALGTSAPGWLDDGAVHLFDAAVQRGWAADGADGFVYTLDWGDRPVVRNRLHWVVAEAIAAAAALREGHGDERYERLYRAWWDHAARRFIDRAGGSWWHELDPQGRPASTVWEGKPDTYHAVQATLVPRLPLTHSIAAAIAAGELR